MSFQAQTDMKGMGVKKMDPPNNLWASYYQTGTDNSALQLLPSGRGFRVSRAPRAGWIIMNINSCLWTFSFSTQICNVDVGCEGCAICHHCQQVFIYMCMGKLWCMSMEASVLFGCFFNLLCSRCDFIYCGAAGESPEQSSLWGH